MNPNVDVLKCLIVAKTLELYNYKKYGIACDQVSLDREIAYVDLLLSFAESNCDNEDILCEIETLAKRYKDSCNPKLKNCNKEIYTHICNLMLIDETVDDIPCNTIVLTLLN